MQLNRYNAASVFVGPSVAVSEHTTGNITQLYGITDASYNFEEPLTDVEGLTFGDFERARLAVNEVNLSLEYYTRDGENERRMGFIVDPTGGMFSDFRLDERNYFVAVKNDHLDYLDYSGYDVTVYGFGQGTLTSYGLRGSIGQPLKTNASFSFLNISVNTSGYDIQLPIVHKDDGTTYVSYGTDNLFYTGSGDSGDIESFTGSGTSSTGDADGYYLTGSGTTEDWGSLNAIYTLPYPTRDDSEYFAVGPGDIRLDIPEDATFGILVSGGNACIIQDFSLDIALPRITERPLGYVYPVNRQLDTPIEVRLSVNALVNTAKAGALNERLCNNSGQTIELAVRPRCVAATESDTFTGDGVVADWAADAYSYLFTGNGSGIDWDSDYLSYLYMGTSDLIKYRLGGMRLESTSVNYSLGNFQSVSFNWSSRVYDEKEEDTSKPSVVLWAPNLWET